MNQQNNWSAKFSEALEKRNAQRVSAEPKWVKDLPLPIYWCEAKEVALFEDAIKKLKSKKPRMIELGCAEAQYSHIFWKATGGTNVCLDILPRQIEVAKTYCPEAEFIHGYVGAQVHLGEIQEDNYGAKKIALDSLISQDKRVDILHMDIQGAETYVAEELAEKQLYGFIDFIFISTHLIDVHSNRLDVVKHIPDYFTMLVNEDDVAMSDGLVFARNERYKGDINV